MKQDDEKKFNDWLNNQYRPVEIAPYDADITRWFYPCVGIKALDPLLYAELYEEWRNIDVYKQTNKRF